jgi:hypothetical protein
MTHKILYLMYTRITLSDTSLLAISESKSLLVQKAEGMMSYTGRPS